MMNKIFNKKNMILVGTFLAGVITSGLVRRKVPGAAKLPTVS